MDYRGQRPPRSARPPQQSPPSYPDPADVQQSRPPYVQGGVSFQDTERGDRQEPLDQARQRQYSAYQHSPTYQNDPNYVEAGSPFADGRVGRKKSLVRPDREKIEPGHRQWHYRSHAANVDNFPSSTSSEMWTWKTC